MQFVVPTRDDKKKMVPYKHVHLYRSIASSKSSLSDTTSTASSLKESNWFRPKAIIKSPSDLARQEDGVLEQATYSREYHHDEFSIGVSDSHICITEGDLVYFWGGRNSTKGRVSGGLLVCM